MFKTELAREIWQKEYRYGTEEPIDTFKRIAKALAAVETTDQKYWEEKFLKLLVSYNKDGIPDGIKFSPGGRITANAGTSYKKATMINCFSGDTRLITKEYGVIDFKSHVDEDVTVLTKKGWKPARLKFFGYQQINSVTFKPAIAYEAFVDCTTGRLCKKGTESALKKLHYIPNEKTNVEFSVKVTPDHRWPLVSGENTVKLSVGDTVESCAYDSSSTFENVEYKSGFIHGLVFGDGSSGYKYSESNDVKYYIRLCGDKAQYQDLFDNVCSFDCNSGDPVAYLRTEKKLKEIPDTINPEYVKGFIDGWAATDGCSKLLCRDNVEISSQNHEALDWLVQYAYLGGYFVRGDRTDSNEETNYGERSALLRRITLSKNDTKWRVVKIEEENYEEVFCAVVPEEHFFTLENGIYTSNCFVSGPITSADIKYVRKSDEGDVSYEVKYKTDDNPDDLMNIFLTVVEQAKTLASEGGYGINFGFIRPRGSIIKGTGIKHPGVMSYMKIWDSVSECIVKGSDDGYVDLLKNFINDDKVFGDVKDNIKKKVRKGAMMGALPCHHPDIEEFVKAKQEKGVLTKFNTSVLIDDAFMTAVENDAQYDLHFKGTVYKRIKAKELYDLIMESCYNRGEPGVLFFDNMQKNNPISYLGKVNCSNPCLHGDSLLLTKTGLSRIKEVSSSIATIWNGEAWVESRVFCSGIKPVFEIKMSNGMSIKATLDHKVDVEGEQVELGQTLGKTITRLSGAPWKGVPSLLCEDYLVCLGFVFGDANYHVASGRYKYVYIGENDSEVEAAFKKINVTLEESSRYDKRTLPISFSDSCEDLDFPKTTLPERSLSEKILSLPPEELRQFLKGLYSANGSVIKKYSRVSLKAACKELATQLQIVLMALGIKSYITTNKTKSVDFLNGTYVCKKSYDLNITSDDIAEFEKQIGFIQTYKNAALAEIPRIFGNKKAPKVTSIEYVGEERVYDFTEHSLHWGFVNGLKVHNCGEVTGLPTLTTVCLLGSFNLSQYVYIDESRKPCLDYKGYTDDIVTATRLLDNVNDISYGVLPPYEWAIKNLRQIGMGLNAVGSTLAMLKIPYNSPDAIAFVEELCKIKENVTWQTSALLAKEKGVFSAYKKELFENTEYFKSDRITEETKNLLRKYGARNAKTTTNPPLGNGSLVCNSVSNGIEPIYKLDIERTVICIQWPEGLDTSNVKKQLTEKKGKDFTYWQGTYKGKRYYYEEHNRGLCEKKVIRDYGYQWLLDNFPGEDHSAYLTTTKDLEVEDHINMQAVAQHYCNQSISKTVNVNKSFPFSKFKEMYIKGWKKGLIGVTAYREGSMEAVLSEISNAELNKEIIKRDIKLPDTFINGNTRIIKKEGKKFYLTFSYLPSDLDKSFPICMWIQTNASYKEKDDLRICNKAARELAKLAYRSGIDEKIITEAVEKIKEDYPHNRLGRMISLNLRHNVPRERILLALTDLEGDSISSLLFSVRKFLAETISDGTTLPGYKCPSCGSTNVYIEAGCKKCKDCLMQACG